MGVHGAGRTALSGEQSVALLASARRGRLITTLGALPAAEPVPFVAQGRQVVVRVVEPDPIRDGDVLSLQVDDIDELTGAGWSVLVTGSARRIGAEHDLVGALGPKATQDWHDPGGQLILLGNPLVRGVTIERPSPTPRTGQPSTGQQSFGHRSSGEPSSGQRPSGHAAEALHGAVALAARAPSLPGPRVWRWQVGPAGLDLFAGEGPATAVTGPNARALLIGCGASLQHARTALAAAGWAVRTETFADPDHPDHVAALRLLGRVPPHDDDLRLAGAAARRPTEPVRIGPDRIPDEALDELAAAAGFEDAVLHQVVEGVEWLRVSPLADAAGSAMPAARDFAVAAQGVLGAVGVVGHPALAVLCAAGDERRAWLRAGAAMAGVALAAEALGLVSSVVPVPAGAAASLRGVLPEGLPEPHLLLRIGVPASKPVTPRARSQVQG